MVASFAFEVGDYKYCSDVCCRLISRSFVPAWDVMHKLGRCAAYQSPKQKDFLAFAILHCPRDSTEEMIEARFENLHSFYLCFQLRRFDTLAAREFICIFMLLQNSTWRYFDIDTTMKTVIKQFNNVIKHWCKRGRSCNHQHWITAAGFTIWI